MNKQKTKKIQTKEEAEKIFDLYISADAELAAINNLSKDRNIHYTDVDDNCVYICWISKVSLCINTVFYSGDCKFFN